ADRDRAAALEAGLAEALARPAVAGAVEAALAAYRVGEGDARAADRLHRLLERQAYRLAFWRLASQEINYRRFFDINDLAGLRMEVPALFDASHALVLDLVGEGRIQGIRLDHVDGLLDPAAYLDRLRRATARAAPEGRGVTLHVEKILHPDEPLRTDWRVEGTTGYDALNQILGVLVDPAGVRAAVRVFQALTGDRRRFETVVIETKRLIMRTALAAELSVLANGLNRLAKTDRDTRDYSLTGLREALANVVAHFPVYRSYVGEAGADDSDRAVIARAVGAARRAAATPDTSIYDFLEAVLTTDIAGTGRSQQRPAARAAVALARKAQQYTGPVTAKAMEDTAFYRWVPFVALNEVGGEPGHPPAGLDTFHAENAARRAYWPVSMVATATHDTKRGEDTRARLCVLSELPRVWTDRVRRWRRLAADLRVGEGPDVAPSPADELLVFQTVVGAWPLGLDPGDGDGLAAFCDRVAGYMEKAMREAKARTSWAVNDPAYERAVADYVAGLLDPARPPALLGEMAGLVAEIAEAGAVNGLAQTVMKLTVPGLPDLYQGTEFWDFSLVDPDNRRPVDFEARAAALAEAGSAPNADAIAERVAAWRDGRVKQAIAARLLRLRAERPALFAEGDYRPLRVGGEAPNRVVAYTRSHGGATLVVAVPRLVAGRLIEGERLRVDWGDTALDLADLDGASVTDILTGTRHTASQTTPLAELTATAPVFVGLAG
ncbi:MAG: malto-oligosyltrehalose synthase, partial [Azospirillaceae bacterium]